MKINLKPCPFCGASASIEEVKSAVDAVRKSAGCSTEGCQGYQSEVTFATHREAAEAWNTRTEGPTDTELLLEYHEQQKEWWRTNTNDPHNIGTALYTMHCEMVDFYDALTSGDARRNFYHNANIVGQRPNQKWACR